LLGSETVEEKGYATEPPPTSGVDLRCAPGPFDKSSKSGNRTLIRRAREGSSNCRAGFPCGRRTDASLLASWEKEIGKFPLFFLLPVCAASILSLNGKVCP
jgi:hypothetical protein